MHSAVQRPRLDRPACPSNPQRQQECGASNLSNHVARADVCEVCESFPCVYENRLDGLDRLDKASNGAAFRASNLSPSVRKVGPGRGARAVRNRTLSDLPTNLNGRGSSRRVEACGQGFRKASLGPEHSHCFSMTSITHEVCFG